MKLNRIILGLIFVFTLFLLCYTYADEGNYQNNDVVDILNGNSPKNVFIAGPITDIFDNGFEVYNIKDKTAYRVKTDLKIGWGNAVYILGILNQNNEVIITKIMTFKQEDVIMVILRSLGGLIIFSLVFTKFWKFNPQKIRFIRRK